MGDRTIDTDAQPFDSYNALPDLKRSARVTDAQKQTDALKQYEGRQLEVLWIENPQKMIAGLSALGLVVRSPQGAIALLDGTF